MAGSRKKIRQKNVPSGRQVMQRENPGRYYDQKPAWTFAGIDDESMWAFSKDNAGEGFWSEILPALRSFETQTWSEILVSGKKQNHSISPESLNPEARRRLSEMYVEADSIVSLRLNGKHRLYGYITDGVYSVLWYDSNHGDNGECVCRSHKKHT